MIDSSLFLMKIVRHYNFQTKSTPFIDNIIEIAVAYFKRILMTLIQ